MHQRPKFHLTPLPENLHGSKDRVVTWVVHAGQAQAMGLVHTVPESLDHRTHIGLRDDVMDQLSGRLQEYARGLSLFIPHDLAARRIVACSCDTC